MWFISILAASAVLLGTAAFTVYRVDPYFHFHKPLTDRYYYELDNQRSQNDGILRSFDYDALITGTSMTENFKTSEAERLFGGKFVKVPYSGATYREINECVEKALKENPGLKTVIRGLDMVRFLDAKDLMRTDLGSYPFYLYDDDPFNDVEYLFNRDILFGTVREMIQNTKEELEQSYKRLRVLIRYHRIFGIGRVISSLSSKGHRMYQDILDNIKNQVS